MEDAHVRRSGAHAADHDSRDDLWRAQRPPTPRLPLAVVPAEPAEADEQREIPDASGARASRPTSSQAAFGRTLRALAELEIPDLDLRLEQRADPRRLTDGWSRVAAGVEPAFALPGLLVAEPAFAQAVDWMVCAALRSVDPATSTSFYFRLTSRPMSQAPFEEAAARLGEAVLRRQVLTGAYRLVSGTTGRRPRVQLAAVGPTLPEVIEAAAELEAQGIGADVVDVVSADAVFAAWQRALMLAVRSAATPSIAGVLRQAFDLDVPLVAVHDQGAATLAWLGSALGVPSIALGPPAGERGTLSAPVDSATVVSAALAALSL